MGIPSELAQTIRLLPCTWEVTGSNLGQDTGYSAFRDFPQSLQINTSDCFELSHDRFFSYLSNSLFTIHRIIRRYVL
jgi:hypothetical protein